VGDCFSFPSGWADFYFFKNSFLVSMVFGGEILQNCEKGVVERLL
jgi:hypothetical protein